jgi:hypothetical protein
MLRYASTALLAAALLAGSFDAAFARHGSDDDDEISSSDVQQAPLPLAGIPALIALIGGAAVFGLRRRQQAA